LRAGGTCQLLASCSTHHSLTTAHRRRWAFGGVSVHSNRRLKKLRVRCLPAPVADLVGHDEPASHRNAHMQITRLRIWGSWVRIPPGAPIKSMRYYISPLCAETLRTHLGRSRMCAARFCDSLQLSLKAKFNAQRSDRRSSMLMSRECAANRTSSDGRGLYPPTELSLEVGAASSLMGSGRLREWHRESFPSYRGSNRTKTPGSVGQRASHSRSVSNGSMR
jgi:hypothetical protein